MRILLFLLLAITLFGSDYDMLLMRAQASMFPKIILLDKDIAAKTFNGTVSLKIVYSDDEQGQAIEFKKLIDNQYHGKLGDFHLSAELDNIDNISVSDNATAYMFFGVSGSRKRTLIQNAAKRHRICFGYDYKDFNHNVLISLLMKEKTYIYLNKASLHDYEISFIPVFYKIVKVLE